MRAPDFSENPIFNQFQYASLLLLFVPLLFIINQTRINERS